MKRFYCFIIVFLLISLNIWLFIFLATNKAPAHNDALLLVKDGAGQGRDLYIPEKPERVVILSASSFEMWVGLGGVKKVVGVSRFRESDSALYEKINDDTIIFPPYAHKNPEAIISLQPDLVIINGYDGAQDFLGEFLRRENIPLMTLPCRTVEDTYREIRLFGQLLKNEEKAEKEILRIKENIKLNQEKYSKYAKKKVLLVFGTSESFSMFTPDTRQGEFLELACGENIVDRSNQFLGAKHIPLSLEYAALKNPDYIFFMNHGRAGVMERKTKEALSERSAWNTINAVKEGNTKVLPSMYFITNPGFKTDYAIESISKILYDFP